MFAPINYNMHKRDIIKVINIINEVTLITMINITIL
jgi:hypothetical protein